jgi:two-component system NtrC family sensor kinase
VTISGIVLIVNDSLTVRMDLAEAFEAAGFRTSGCATAARARELLARETISVVILDSRLPDVDGAEFLREIRAGRAGESAVVLMLSTEAETEAQTAAEVEAKIEAETADGVRIGADAYIGRPYNVGQVVARAEELARLRGGPAAEAIRVLAVDDSLTFLHAVADMLGDQGYDVVLAHSGEEALELLTIQSVDCILLDLMMPGLSGHETCRRIKAASTTRDVPLIMLTSLDDRDAMIEALGVGADDFVPKTGEFEVLAARIRAQLRRKQFEEENRRIREELLHKEIEATQARAAIELAQTRAALIGELERRNQELEAFSYSVSHDLRAPLRSIDGFSRVLMEDCGDRLDETGEDCLRRIRGAAQRMAELIDDLMQLSRVNLAELSRSDVDLSELVRIITDGLARSEPDRHVVVDIKEGVVARADSRLIRAALENLLGNAWKFTAKVQTPVVEFSAEPGDGGMVYRIRDNGAGFDMGQAQRLFKPFQRLHTDDSFPGTGIGLATVRRVVDRHGGAVWAESAVGAGATFRFTIPSPRPGGHET